MSGPSGQCDVSSLPSSTQGEPFRPRSALAAELVRRGHQVHVLSDPIVEPAARSAGCTFSPWREAPHLNSREEQTALIAAIEGRNPYRAFRAAKEYAGKEMTRRFAQDLVSTVRDTDVEAVLSDGLPGMLIGGQATGLPTAVLLANIYARPTVGRPLLGTGWSPGQGTLVKARDNLVPKHRHVAARAHGPAPQRRRRTLRPAAAQRPF